MEFASYDFLLRKVDILKVENNNLRKDLADNCNHLSKLENEASTMKDVLIHHLNNGRMNDECERTTTTTTTTTMMTAATTATVKVNDSTSEEIPDNQQAMLKASDSNCSEDELPNHNPGSFQAQIQQLENERAKALQDIEAEEKEKQLFNSHMERINQQLFHLSHANANMQVDNVRRRQLESEANSLRETMLQKLGSRGEMHRREEARVHRICLIEKEIEKLCQLQNNSNKFVSNDMMDVESLNEKSMTDLCEEDECKHTKSSDEKLASKMTISASKMTDPFTSTRTPAGVQPKKLPEDDSTGLASIYHGTWPVDKVLWHSGPSSVGGPDSIHSFHNHDTGSVASGKSHGSSGNGYQSRSINQQLGTKVEMVYSLLSMLGSHDKDDMSQKLLSMSSSVDSCVAMRQSGCMPLLVELLHGDASDDVDDDQVRKRPSKETRMRASEALHNVVHSHPDDKRGRREARVLRLLEQIRDYCGSLSDSESESSSIDTADSSDDDDAVNENGVNKKQKAGNSEANVDKHPVPAMAMLMKLSFDEEHRHAMCQLGGLQATAELLQDDYETHGNLNDQYCITLRRYAGMALTNLTFGDGTNKALLCSLRPFMKALVAQLYSPSEDLRQVIASVLRNLSWRADQASKKTLREVGAVATLMRAAMEAKKESTLKSILSALWNLSAHCSMNKADICAVDGALAFIVGTLTYRSPSNTHSIVENGGGILRNISSHIAVREDYRAMLRQHNCLQILLLHLRSPSLTIVSNACGTLWNLSARCSDDQQALWSLGAVGMLRNLVHSKHKMISMGSSAALKNLLAAKPGGLAANAARNAKSNAPSLLVRKQKALEAELDQNLSETCENLDSPKTSPTHHRCDMDRKFDEIGRQHNNTNLGLSPSSAYQLHGRMYHSVGGQLPLSPSKSNVSRSESKDSILSTQSDSSHDRLRNLDILLRHRQKPAVCHDQHGPTIGATPPGVLESRIQYVMQEVTRQIALESEIIKNDCNAPKAMSCYLKPSFKMTTQPSKSVVESTPKKSFPVSDHDQLSGTDLKTNSAYTNLSTMIEYMNLDDDGDNSYEPVDYSLKYSEGVENASVKLKNLVPCKEIKLDSDNRKPKDVDWKINAKSTKKPPVYGDYAETDLDGPDQPTNFSLRYTEDTDTTDAFRAPDPQEGSPYMSDEYGMKGPSFHDDTIMTYCTEDTPLNFSTSTSLSDLRELKDTPASIEEEGQDIDDSSVEQSRLINQDEKVDVGTDRESNEKVIQIHAGNTDCVTDTLPDNMVTYCVEGTPGCFSRMSPLSSIVSNDISGGLGENHSKSDGDLSYEIEGDKNKEQNDGLDGVVLADRTDFAQTETTSDERCNESHEGKTVTFSEDQHYTEETPLMFSRCSSLGSLSSFEQHSIHDDRSSVISDFSRRASEVVSPSDLPDSPGQTMPPSPRTRHAPISFVSRMSKDISGNSKIARPCPTRRSTVAAVAVVDVVQPQEKKSVFEDAARVYLDEGTPLELSKANSVTSLKSCGVDTNNESAEEVSEAPSDQRQTTKNQNEVYDEGKNEIKNSLEEVGSLEIKVENVEKLSSAVLSEDEDGDDNEDDILAACINSAMPNNSRHNKQKHNNTKLCSKINILSGGVKTVRPRGISCIPIKSSNLKLGSSSQVNLPQSTSDSTVNDSNLKLNNVISVDKNLSLDCGSSDTSSVFDEDPDRILAQCIRSGMPKSSNDLSKHAGNLLLDRQTNGSSVSSDKDCYDKVQFSQRYLRTRAAASSLTANNIEGNDDVTVFAMEGTPVNFSNATSLSNLTVDSSKSDNDVQMFTKNKDIVCHKSWASAKFDVAPTNNVFRNVAPRTNANARQYNLPAPKLNGDSMIRYTEEGTPSCLSRGSSLSALSMTNTDASGQTNYSDNAVSLKPFMVEGTPVCFSQNSSLSSLSVESLLVEPSPSEQALLEECISSGMPKTHHSSTLKQPKLKLNNRSTNSRLPCPVTPTICKEKRKELLKMDCIDEDLRTKNVKSAAVVHEDHIDTSAAAEAAVPQNANKTEAVFSENCISSDEISKPKEDHLLEFGGALLVLLEATKVSLEVQHVAKAIPDSMEHSLVSGSSDLIENVNPPSVIGDLSSASESLVRDSKGVPIVRPRVALPSPRSKNVPELVMRALADSNVSKQSSPTTASESLDNVSMLDNVKPPSMIDDVDLTSSMYSVCSIVSEVADLKSEGGLSGLDSEAVFKCMKPAIAMAEMYALDAAKIKERRGYSVSEIENVNPPSTLLEVTANTANDFTERLPTTDTLENNDTDIEDDLPDDHEPWNGEDEIICCNDETQLKTLETNLDITPEEVMVLQEDANRVLNKLKEIQFQDCYEDALCEDIECETLSLVSNDSDSSYSTSEVRPKLNIQHGRPRIVKPNSDQVEELEDKIKTDYPKSIRGRRKALYSRKQIVKEVKEISSVKPTRTSALRATQSQQKVASGCAPTVVSSKQIATRSSTFIRSNNRNVNTQLNVTNDDVDEGDESRPLPPIKQATFTKDKPTHDSPPLISPSKTRIPAFNNNISCPGNSLKKPGVDERPPRGSIVQPTLRTKIATSKCVDSGGAVAVKSQKIEIESTKTSSPQQPNRFMSRRGQSSSPVQRSLSNSTVSPRSITSSFGVRNSPSTHSLGSNSGKRSGAYNCKVVNLADNLSNTKRSSSNGSLCSNSTSSSTNNSRKSGFSAKKEVQSKVASLWKSVNRKSPPSSSSVTNKPVVVTTPQKQNIRSSTVEKLPSDDNEEDKQIKPSPGFFKKGTRALAEARLQEWLARKARIAEKRTVEFGNDQPEEATRNHLVSAAIVTPFNYTPNNFNQQVTAMATATVVPQRSLIPTPNQVSPFIRQQPRDAYLHDGNPDKRRPNGKPCLVSTV